MLTHSSSLRDAFSHPFTHTPTSSSLPLHPVDAPNKATCVVSGCLGERSPRQAACLCLSRDRLSPRCSVLFSLPFLLFLPQICHSCICLTHSSCLSHSFPTTPSHSSCLSLSSTLYCIHFISLCLIAFSTTFSSNKHKTSSFTYSLSHWLHTNLSFQNLPDVIHKAFLRSKPHWQGM